MALDFKHASAIEGVRFTAQVGVPNVLQGLFKKREPVAKAAGSVPLDREAYKLTAGLVKKYGPDPFYVRVATDEALLVHHPEDLEVVLGGSPSPFASDPDAKKKGMSAFQPHALTISRGDLWANRRAFAESVLQTGKPVHKLAKGFAQTAYDEADALRALDRPIAFDDINKAFQELTRIVVFGQAAAGDLKLTEQLGALMAAGNKMPGKPAKGYDAFHEHVDEYVKAPDPKALTGLIAAAPHDGETDVAGQLIHWLFAMGDTLPANIFRALALLGTHPDELALVQQEFAGLTPANVRKIGGASYTAGCLFEAMRLWPTTALYGRVLEKDHRFANGVLVKEGTQVLIHNLFNHRNRERITFADRFAPDEWVSGTAGQDWTFNFFSHGPQGCPGVGLSMFLGAAFIGRLVTTGGLKIAEGPKLSPAKALPYALDVYSLKIGL